MSYPPVIHLKIRDLRKRDPLRRVQEEFLTCLNQYQQNCTEKASLYGEKMWRKSGHNILSQNNNHTCAKKGENIECW